MEDWPRCTFRDALARSAAAWPEAEAIVTPEGRITYAALAADVDRVAANLHRLGLRRGDHMALCMGNSVRWAVILFAAASLGAVTVPVNTRWRPPEIEYALRQSEAAMLVTADRLLKMDFIAALRGILPEIDATLPAARLPKLRCVIVDGDDVPAAVIPGTELDRAAVFHPVTFDPGDVALIQYTSGTTSAPKGAMLTHDSMLRDAFHVGRRLGLRPGDRYLSQRPLFHVAGVTLSLLTAILAGATYVTTPTFDAAEAVRLMREEGITHLSGNDTMFLMILAVPPTPDERIALRGGWAAASETVLRQAQARFGMPGLCVAYGQSEASPNVAMGPWDDDLEKRLSGHAFPLPGLDVRIRDESGADLPPGSLGQITVRGWCVMRGYWNMPEQTAQTIDADGWLRTGDLGVMDEAGRLRFAGRAKELIRVGGENVAPAEVEDALNAHPDVVQAQVVGVPDPRLLEVPAAYVILRDGAACSPDDLIAWCKDRLAGFRVPRHLRVVENFDAIGMTASSKVQKGKLREHAIRDLGLG